MKDEQFAQRLSTAPNPGSAVGELFERTRRETEATFFLTIIDFETLVQNGTNYLMCEMRRHWVIQQFADYFSRLLGVCSDNANLDQESIYRLQMLAYSQFWECIGIQRLLGNLTRLGVGKPFEPRLYLDDKKSTYSRFHEIREDLRSESLLLGGLLDAIYSNQIRNAFAHSEIWFIKEVGYIDFMNCDQTKQNEVGSILYGTWEKLFEVTVQFITHLFRARRRAERQLLRISPYRISIPELKHPISLSRDARGFWSAKPCR